MNKSDRPKQVIICQGRTCRKYGSKQVLEAFQTNLELDIEIIASGCLGQCGNGPMVIILPEEVWYWRVQPQEVSIIIEQHLGGNQPVKAMLYHKFHPN